MQENVRSPSRETSRAIRNLHSFKNNYLIADSTSGSFDFNEVAIKISDDLTDRLRLGIQVLGSSIGNVQGSYSITADRFDLDCRFRDWLGLRGGRTKIPFGLYNEIQEIEAARIPVLLPQAVYELLNEQILLVQTGAERAR